MLTKKQNIELGRFALYIESHDEQFKYMLLNRLQTDCKYYLGYEYMYIIYNSLKIKPEWLTEQQIKVYSDLMLQIKNDKNF